MSLIVEQRVSLRDLLAFFTQFSRGMGPCRGGSRCSSSSGLSGLFRFCCNSVSYSEYEVAIGKLKANRAIGPDGVPAYIVKACADHLSVPLMYIIDLSINTSVYPDVWKLSKVIPIFKSGAKHDIANYRPISIISSCSRLFEIIVFERLYNEVKFYISEKQHGFLPERSTLTNLLFFTQYLHEAINNKMQVDVIFTDLEKAFDKVEHMMILDSLTNMNVTSILALLVRSYLMDREQYVELRGARSRPYMSTSGVPQGSNLGPLLFVIAMHGIGHAVKDSELLLYADDLKLFRRVVHDEDCRGLQNDLTSISDWCSKNGFYMNVRKCSSMTVTLNKNRVKWDYVINGQALSDAGFRRDLGVVVDSSLNFNEHISSKVGEAYRIMGFINRSSGDFDVETCLRLFDSLALPKLEYASVVWCPQYDLWIDCVERVQRKFLKLMYLRRFGYYPPRGFDHGVLLRLFQRLSLKNRRTEACLIFLFKILTNRICCPELLGELPFSTKMRITRDNAKTFYLELPRTNLYKSSPIYRMCNYFNTLCQDIDVAVMSLKQFRGFVRLKLFACQN